ncbi:TniQ family protein [Cyanobacteria bacterium FACHB-63]|nr:TniQ family protein [Cyanobacteria bacterium FACHB-63]
MEPPFIPPWVFTIEPHEGESISHFLGRFRRANYSSLNELGQKTGLGGTLARWEKFRFIPAPTQKQLGGLAELVRLDVAQVALMFPQGVSMKHEPIRLCAACYAEKPYHRLEWQFKATRGCDRHQLRLLSECPNCGKRFKIPALWIEGYCHNCQMTFAEMVIGQKSY